MKQNRRGQSLVEVVIALGVVVILAVSLVSTSLITQRSSRNAKNNTQATKLAQQSIENLRGFRDRKGFSALTNGNCWKLVASDSDPLNWSLSNSGSNTCPEAITLDQFNFNRSIKVENGANSNQKKITVTVTWTDTGGTQTVTNVTNLSNCIRGNVAC